MLATSFLLWICKVDNVILEGITAARRKYYVVPSTKYEYMTTGLKGKCKSTEIWSSDDAKIQDLANVMDFQDNP